MGAVGLHSGQTPATKALRRQTKKASIDELSVSRGRVKESDASKLDHGCGFREDNLTGVGKRVWRANAFGCFGLGRRVSPSLYSVFRRDFSSHATGMMTSTI